jgi:uncharacterized membrane protein
MCASPTRVSLSLGSAFSPCSLFPFDTTSSLAALAVEILATHLRSLNTTLITAILVRPLRSNGTAMAVCAIARKQVCSRQTKCHPVLICFSQALTVTTISCAPLSAVCALVEALVSSSAVCSADACDNLTEDRGLYRITCLREEASDRRRTHSYERDTLVCLSEILVGRTPLSKL